LETKAKDDALSTPAPSTASKDWNDFFTGDEVDASNPTISNYYSALVRTKTDDVNGIGSSPMTKSNASNVTTINPMSNILSAIPSILKDSKKNGKLEGDRESTATNANSTST
jgi:hypothetical protein